MKALVAKSPIGIFAFSENGEMIYYKVWPPGKALEKFLSKDMDTDFVSGLEGYKIEHSPLAAKFLRKNMREYAKGLCSMDDAALNGFLSSFSISLSKRLLQGTMGRDLLIVQAVRTLDDIVRTLNVFTERIYEWYTLHYPELRSVNAEEIIKYGHRENMPNFKGSVGAELASEDEAALKGFARAIKQLNEEKRQLEKYIESSMKEIARNFSSLIDPTLAARLLAAAGSLEKLARMPASTLQLLGAEKALFRHLKKQGKSPKYGIIYNSNIIQSASNEHRGKVARVLSSKLVLAARIDYYSGRDDSQKMKMEMDAEIRKVSQ